MTDPSNRERAVSRETTFPAGGKSPLDDDTPIGAAARRASQVLTPGGTGTLPRPQQQRVLTVANQKGGVGKTTSAVNLAAALALQGSRFWFSTSIPRATLPLLWG